MKTLILQSSDKKEFPISEKAARMSTVIETMIGDVSEENSEIAIPVMIDQVNGDILQLVIEWAEYHKDDPKGDKLPHSDLYPDLQISEWDQKFFDSMDRDTLFTTMLASNYLDIDLLMNSIAKVIANWNNGKTAEELRQMYDIPKDA